MASISLRMRTLDLVRNRPAALTYEEIAKATDTNIKWLSDFATERAKHPCVDKVQAVYEYLKQAPLFEIL